eukprot:gene24118-32535_t
MNNLDSEFEALVVLICASSTSSQQRSQAEVRLMDILSDYRSYNWRRYSSLLLLHPDGGIHGSGASAMAPSLSALNGPHSGSDALCFFIGIGLQRLVWRSWQREFTSEDKQFLTETVIQALTCRPHMQQFARAKLEQVIGTICVLSQSLQPVLGLIVDVTQPNAFTGLSVTRTLFEMLLLSNPKVSPIQLAVLLPQINDIITPLTNLSCGACSLALQSYNEDSHGMMVTALDLLKIITSTKKVQIGPHISSDVVHLLFTVAEMGAESDSVFHRCAMSSIEVLTEIMSKKYIPPPSNAGSNSLSSGSGDGLSSSARQGLSNTASSNSSGSIDMLLSIVTKSVSLLTQYRLNGNIDDSPIVLSLLEFVAVFSESHLERCINMCNGFGSATTAPSAYSPSTNMSLSQSVKVFFDELVAITSVSSDPQVLIKIVSMWNRVVSISSVRDALVGQPAIGLPTASHLLQCCLTQTNAQLLENLDELIDDFKTEPVVDQHTKEILNNLSAASSAGSNGKSGGRGNADNSKAAAISAEESGYVGTELRIDVSSLLGELVTCHEVSLWTQQTVSQMVNQSIALLFQSHQPHTGGSVCMSKGQSSAVVDLCFLLRLLPMVSGNKHQLVVQLVLLIGQLIDNSMLMYGSPLVHLMVNCCQITDQLLQSIVCSEITDSTTSIPGVISVLLRCVENVLQENSSATNSGGGIIIDSKDPSSSSAISPPYAIVIALCVLLHRAVVVYSDFLEMEFQLLQQQQPHIPSSTTKTNIGNVVIKLLDRSSGGTAADSFPGGDSSSRGLSSIEVYVVLMCTLDFLDPNTVADSLVLQFLDLAKNHSLSKAPRRQLLISKLTPLQVVSTFNSLLYSAKLFVSLACSLLQSLGKKSFGKAASEVLELSVLFAGNSSSTPDKDLGVGGAAPSAAGANLTLSSTVQVQLFESEQGCALVRQFLELAQVVAVSTPATSPTAHMQAMITQKLLVYVSSGLSLEQTLKCGIAAIGCYWQKNSSRAQSNVFMGSHVNNSIHAIMSSSNSLELNSSSSSSNSSNNGTNVQPIVELLVQLFSVGWFQNTCWGSLLTPCLRAILLRFHLMHIEVIETLLASLVKAGNDIFMAFLRTYFDGNANIIHGHTNPSNSRLAPLDMRVFIDNVLVPISAEIARL